LDGPTLIHRHAIAALRGGCFFGRGDRIEKAEELLNAGYFERVVNAVAHSHQRQTAAVVLAADVSSDQRPDPRRINVGNTAEIDDQGLGLVAAEGRLKIKYCGQDDRSGKAQNALSGLGSGPIVDAKRVLLHGKDIILKPD